jgi:hypothetical protein
LALKRTTDCPLATTTGCSHLREIDFYLRPHQAISGSYRSAWLTDIHGGSESHIGSIGFYSTGKGSTIRLLLCALSEKSSPYLKVSSVLKLALNAIETANSEEGLTSLIEQQGPGPLLSISFQLDLLMTVRAAWSLSACLSLKCMSLRLVTQRNMVQRTRGRKRAFQRVEKLFMFTLSPKITGDDDGQKPKHWRWTQSYLPVCAPAHTWR